jgi:hypothetical protein
MKIAWLIAVVALYGITQPPGDVNQFTQLAVPESDTGVSRQQDKMAEPSTIHFDTDIIPVFTKAGCNAGACHGAAAGRGGFRLSLFGSDPTADYDAIVHQFEGRRVNLSRPADSLVFRKPSGELEHEGGTPLLDDSLSGEMILHWIQSGARRGTPRRLIDVEIQPQSQFLTSVNATVPLKVVARFDDQTTRDVTHWTLFTPSDPSAVRIDDNNRAMVVRRGQHVVIARYLDRVIRLTSVVPLSDLPIDLSSAARTNLIDDHILRTLEQLRIPISPDADDFQWLRRVTLDLTGLLPAPDEVQQFVADDSPDKREQIVDRLLNSEAYVDLWSLRFSRLLRMHSLPNETEPIVAYSRWLRDIIRSDSGFDQLTKQLLTSFGDSNIVGPANFGRMVSDARAHAELVGQAFAGIRLACANCHNHPLDQWTQDDYHGLAAVFAPLDRSRHVKLLDRGSVTNLRTGEPAVPRIPGLRNLTAEDDRLTAVVEWLTSDTDLLLARATTNRLWRFLFGRGLCEPVDDLRETNPATHPELLQQLTREFASRGYRLRPILKMMVLSSTYGRSDQSVAGNEADDRFYSHAIRRPLEPEVLLDAISDITGVQESFEPHHAKRAVQVIDAALPAEALDVLGRCHRVAGCQENEAGAPGLAAQLHLVNGTAINRRTADSSGRLQQMIVAHRSVAEILGEFWIRGLGRHASAEELSNWQAKIEHSEATEQQRRLEDFVWSLLNSRDFQENH